MALRDSMRASAAPYLRPDETVQAVFSGQTVSQWLIVMTGFILFLVLNRYRMVVATSQRIIVFDSGKWSMKKAQSVLFELPRSTRLGPASGVWQKVEVGDETLRVHRRFFKDISAADSEATATV
jgi:Bacterial PH domain